MSLIGNYSQLDKTFATTPRATGAQGQNRPLKPSAWFSRNISLPQKTAYPNGYAPGSALFSPLKSGGIASQNIIVGEASLTATAISARLSTASMSGVATLSGSLAVLTPGAASLSGAATLTAAAQAVSSLSSTLTGAATVSANLSSIVPLASALTGAATMAPNLTGLGRLEAVIDVGAGDVLSPGSLANAVWDTVIADHVTVGTTGKALSDAGGAGNPWAADTSTNNDPGTFGALVQKLLTVAKFLGLK